MSKLVLAVGPEMDRGGRKVRPVVVLEQDEALLGRVIARDQDGAVLANSVQYPAWGPSSTVLYVRGTDRSRDAWAAFVPVDDWPAVEKAVVEFGGMIRESLHFLHARSREECRVPECAAIRRGIALADGKAPEKIGEHPATVCYSSACEAEGRHVEPCTAGSNVKFSFLMRHDGYTDEEISKPSPVTPPRCRYAAAVYTGQERALPLARDYCPARGEMAAVALHLYSARWRALEDLRAEVKVATREWPTCLLSGKPVGLAYLDVGEKVMALWVCPDCVKR